MLKYNATLLSISYSERKCVFCSKNVFLPSDSICRTDTAERRAGWSCSAALLDEWKRNINIWVAFPSVIYDGLFLVYMCCWHQLTWNKLTVQTDIDWMGSIVTMGCPWGISFMHSNLPIKCLARLIIRVCGSTTNSHGLESDLCELWYPKNRLFFLESLQSTSDVAELTWVKGIAYNMLNPDVLWESGINLKQRVNLSSYLRTRLIN